MVKLIFVLFVSLILLFPIYEHDKIKIKSLKSVNENIPLSVIEEGKVFVYDENLTYKGKFSTFLVYKNFYEAKNINIDDLVKKESYIASKSLFEDNILKLFDFRLKNSEYSLISDYVRYDIKLKKIWGERFFLFSNDYNVSGNKFFIDRNKNINATNISFFAKVDK